MRLIQLLGEGIEELYNVHNDTDEESLKLSYQAHLECDDCGEFEEYWNQRNPEIPVERVFVEEIYV